MNDSTNAPTAETPSRSLDELVSAAAARHEALARHGRFATSTLVALWICGGLTLAMPVVFVASRDESYQFLAAFLCPIAGILTLAVLIKIAIEAFSGSPRHRDTPQKAVECYISMVKQQRWPEALSCLSWLARNGQKVIRPAIPEIDLAQAAFCIQRPADLKSYWADLGGGQKLRGSRNMNCQVLGVESATESSALVRVRLSIVLDLATADIGGSAWKSASVTDTLLASAPFTPALGFNWVGNGVGYSWPVYRRGGQWFLLQVGLPE
jgi:hypothetical protein